MRRCSGMSPRPRVAQLVEVGPVRWLLLLRLLSRGEGSLHRGSRGMSVASTVGEHRPCGKEVRLMRRSALLLASVVSGLLLTIGVVAAAAGNGGSGNGAPSGPHYNLNLIGFAQGQTYPNNGSGGNVIHVPLSGPCQIDLTEGPFSVLNNNCTNGNALFQLPNPDLLNTGTSSYSVFAAARGKPLGSATANTCFTDTSTSTQYCSNIILTLSRKFGQNSYDNVTKYLLYA